MTPFEAEQKRVEITAALLKDMEVSATQMRALIAGMPAKDLLGYLYAQHIMKAIASDGMTSAANQADRPDENQFLLEYVHAVFASTVTPTTIKFDEEKCAELFERSRKLREQAMTFAMASSAGTKDGLFGPDTANIEFHAKSAWVLLRGNRYQVLEGEFYRYVLTPHDDVLKEIYGVGATEIAVGFQDLANASRSGQAGAIEKILKHMEAAHAFADEQKKPLEEVMEDFVAANADRSESAWHDIDDLLRGGILNVSRHTKLPPKLLADLAYQRGEETEFFAVGDFSGTPFRTLPARKKPLIQLGSDYYAVDPCLTRDAGYRALLYNLLLRKPDYKKAFEDRQKEMSECAFPDILTAQLLGAKVYQEVYYKDSVTKQWCENDTLVLIDDVLFLVEAKAGAAATIASPALDFKRHAQSVQDLVLKAYKQCERFFNYLNSADEVLLYRQTEGKYVECGRIRRTSYRVLVPIGLTVESFSPFSTYCKELPQVVPLLGKHGFVSMSIDDLFVLKRLLPTPGEFAHYMEVRQAVASMRRSFLFDEFDHLGAYVSRNRFDQEIADQLKVGKTQMVVWDGMSNIIDQSFTGEDWEANPIPAQEFPVEVLKLLRALNSIRAPGWLSVESHIRNFGAQARGDLAKMLSDFGSSLKRYPERYFMFVGDGPPLFVWMKNLGRNLEWKLINEKASAAGLCTKSSNVVGVLIELSAEGAYCNARQFKVHIPSDRTAENTHIFDDASRMMEPSRMVRLCPVAASPTSRNAKKVGRNASCPCGSGLKYKRCHGVR